MSAGPQNELRNRLLALMSREDFARLSAGLEPCSLAKGFVLVEAGHEIEHVYFPEVGIASMVAISPEAQQVEVGLFGRDGAGPVPALLGVDASIHRVLIQVAGHGHRIGREDFASALRESASLSGLFSRFAHVMSVQAAFTALSNAVHQIDERLARWILMCHDRSPSDDIALTHEFLSVMLAVRRPSVTTSLHVLEGNRLIRNERGHIAVRDRPGLEEFTHDAYGRPEAEYLRLIGPM